MLTSEEESLDMQIEQNKANLIASTDILEYLHRVIYCFAMLANLGIETFSELLNEYNFPRSENIRECARDILQCFPFRWQEIVQNSNFIDSQITFKEVYFNTRWKMNAHKHIMVKGIRKVLLECLPLCQFLMKILLNLKSNKTSLWLKTLFN